MNYALYINGVFENVLEEICQAQSAEPGLICYLQPYSASTIVELSKEVPTEDDPVTLYISLTSSLNIVSYRAEIIGWENKQEIDPSRLAILNKHIKTHQPGETEIYMTGNNDQPAVNLISVINMERLETPIAVPNFVKKKNNLPLKPRSRAGGWAYVKELPSWVGSLPASAIEEEYNEHLEQQVVESLNSTTAARSKRLETAPKLPQPIQIISKGYRRNKDVIATTLLRANGHCEVCGKEAPFIKAKDGTPYLEVHHKTLLSEGGEDTVENAIATCPNCHRKLHFGAKGK